MIGLISSAVGMIAGAIGNSIDDTKITTTTAEYTPFGNFSNAGLFQGSVAGLDKEEIETETFETPHAKKLLQTIGGLSGGLGGLASMIPGKEKDETEETG